ncbi:hypothetical protein HN827_03755 [archaeon]|nr:hypothetical protein [archaeon]MBT7391919.1 hypothetical protein [archaeon]
MGNKGKKLMILALALTFILGVMSFVSAQPVGGSLTEGESERRVADNSKTHDAVAGNITALDITANQITNIWQGYFGNISGGITLDNADNDTFYDWTGSEPTGEVFAARAAVSDWTTTECSNQTALYKEEEALTILNASSEGINDTFVPGTHPSFTVGSLGAFTTCRNALPYDDTGAEAFWNVLLNADQGTLVYTSIINGTSNAFDGEGTVDFELLVPTDTTQSSTTYYFYLELS